MKYIWNNPPIFFFKKSTYVTIFKVDVCFHILCKSREPDINESSCQIIWTMTKIWLDNVCWMPVTSRRDFFLRPPPLWKFQLSSYIFKKFFWSYRAPPTPPLGNFIPFCGRSMIFSGTAQYLWPDPMSLVCSHNKKVWTGICCNQICSKM